MKRIIMLTFLSLFSLYCVARESVPELTIEKLRENVFLHVSYSYVDGFGLVSANGLVVVDEGKAFIVDTPWSVRDTESLAEWIEENDFELAGSISTHWHGDRTAGIEWLNDRSIPTYATTLTNQFLEQSDREPATLSLRENESTLADGLVEVFYPGAGHTEDNVVVWLPESKVLFGGCLVRSLDTVDLGNTAQANIGQWAQSAHNALSRFPEAELVVPGHGDVGDRRLLEHTKTLAESAANKVDSNAR